MNAIREMTIADLPEVFALRVATVENRITLEELAEDYGLTPATVAQAMSGSARGWVCEADDRIVGFAMGDAATAEMTVLAVLPGYERRGIGKELLARVQDWLFDAGHDELWLVTTPDPGIRAHGFYLSQGWIATGEMRGDEEEKFVLGRSRRRGR